MIIHFISADIILFASYLLRHAIFGEKIKELKDFELHCFIIYAIVYFFVGFGLIIKQLWTCSLAHYLYHTGNGTFQEHWLKGKIFKSYLLGFVAGTFVVILLVHDFYSGDSAPLFMLYNLFFSIVILICFFYLLAYYLRGFWVMWHGNRPVHWMLLIYPLVAMILPLPKFIVRFVCFSIGDKNYNDLTDDYWVTVRSLFYIQGFVNALVYGLTNRISQTIKNKCSKRRNCEDIVEESLTRETINELNQSFREY